MPSTHPLARLLFEDDRHFCSESGKAENMGYSFDHESVKSSVMSFDFGPIDHDRLFLNL